VTDGNDDEKTTYLSQNYYFLNFSTSTDLSISLYFEHNLDNTLIQYIQIIYCKSVFYVY
jgi:hypothetical protein